MSRPKDFCKDCWAEISLSDPVIGRQRPIVANSGSRCATHWREEKKRRKAAAHENYVGKTYGLAPGDYQRLYEAQLKTCAICLRATGKTKRLAVDHDHATDEVRGLLCGPCNSMLAHARDSDMFFYRAAGYLQNPPAQRFLKGDS